MKKILCAAALLLLTACMHTTEIDGHQVTKACELDETLKPVCLEEWHDKYGVRDRADGPAYTLRNAITGTVIIEEWDKGGFPDRANGPAVIKGPDAADGPEEEWWKNGVEVTRAFHSRAGSNNFPITND